MDFLYVNHPYNLKVLQLAIEKGAEVMALDAPYVGYVARETQDKLVVFGEQNKRYDIPKTEIQTT